jgi:hypothetical protein
MKTDKLLHLLQQKKFMRSGGALPLPKAQDGTITDPFIGMRKFYDDAYDALDKYENKQGEVSPFNVSRAWAKAAVKNPHLLFRDRHSLSEQGFSEDQITSAAENPYHKDSPVIRMSDTETKHQYPTDYVVPNEKDVERYNRYIANQTQQKSSKGNGFDLSDEWKDIKRGVRNASRDVRHFIGKEIPRALRNCVNGDCYEFHQQGGLAKAQSGKPYLTSDLEDFNKRTQAYNDSLALYKNYKKPPLGYIPISQSNSVAAKDFKQSYSRRKEDTKGFYYSPNGSSSGNEAIVYYGVPPKKPVQPVELNKVKHPLTQGSYDPMPIFDLMMPDGNRMKKDDFINNYGEAAWLKATRQKYQTGGGLTKAQNGKASNFLQPNNSKLKEGYNIPSRYPSTELATSIGGEDGEPAYLIPSFKYGHILRNPGDEFYNTGDYIGGPFKTWQEADKWDIEVRHPYVEKGQPIPSPLKWWGEGYRQGGSLPKAQVGITNPFMPGKTLATGAIEKTMSPIDVAIAAMTGVGLVPSAIKLTKSIANSGAESHQIPWLQGMAAISEAQIANTIRDTYEKVTDKKVGGLAKAQLGNQWKPGSVSQRDSVQNMAYNTMTWEENRGDGSGYGLSDFGNPRLPAGATKDDAVAWYMQNIYPQLGDYPTAMEKAQAGDFLYNSGMNLLNYTDWDNRKDDAKAKQSWETKKKTLNTNDRRVTLNNARDKYYQNTAPSGSAWDLKTQGPHPAYWDTWYGRQHATDQYVPLTDADVTNTSNKKFYPVKKQTGGLAKAQNGTSTTPTRDLNPNISAEAKIYFSNPETDGQMWYDGTPSDTKLYRHTTGWGDRKHSRINNVPAEYRYLNYGQDEELKYEDCPECFDKLKKGNYFDKVKNAVTQGGSDPMPIFDLMMPTGNRMKREDFINIYGEAAWLKATRQKFQLGGQDYTSDSAYDLYKQTPPIVEYNPRDTPEFQQLAKQYDIVQGEINKFVPVDNYVKRLKEVTAKAVKDKVSVEKTDFVDKDIRDDPESNFCISGSCYLADQAGDKSFKYYSNDLAQKAAEKKQGRYLEQDEKWITPGDIMQFKRGNSEKGGPYHAYTVLELGEPNTNGSRSIQVAGSPGSGPIKYEQYFLGKDNKVYKDAALSERLYTQLLKRISPNISDSGNLVKERDALKMQMDKIDATYLNPERQGRNVNNRTTEFFFDQDAWKGGNPEKFNYDEPDRDSTYTEGKTPGEQINPKDAKLFDMMGKYSDNGYKTKFMKDHNISGPEYDAIVKNMFGIYGAETKFGTDISAGFKFPEPRWLTDTFGVGDSVGPFQLGRKNFSKKLKDKYTRKELHDPMIASEATLEFLAENLPLLRKRALDTPDQKTYTQNITQDNYLEFIPYLHNAQSWLRGDKATLSDKKKKDVVTGDHDYKKLVDFYASKFQAIPSSIVGDGPVIEDFRYDSEWVTPSNVDKKQTGGLAKAQLGIPSVATANQQAIQNAGTPYLNRAMVQAVLTNASQPVTNTLGRVISTPKSREKERREKVVANDPSQYSVMPGFQSDYNLGIQEPGADNSVLSDPIAMAAALTAGGVGLGATALSQVPRMFLGNLASEATVGLTDVGKYLTRNTALKNTYKYNPWAENLNDVNSSYRVAGLDAAEDFKNTGILRSVAPEIKANFAEGILPARPTSFPSFQKGYADMSYLPEEGGVIFKTDLPTFKRGELNPVTEFPIKGRHYAHRVIDPKTGATVTNIPGTDVKMYGSEPHWLKGYKEVEVPKSNFKSEIDWAKWNKEIPDNKVLMQEYNAIEQQAKADGSWMKNSDGSAFQGTPEQFVQQNSQNFKNSFPEGFNRTYRGANNNSTFRGNLAKSNNPKVGAVFAGNKNSAVPKYGSFDRVIGPEELGMSHQGTPGYMELAYKPTSNNVKFSAKISNWDNINRDLLPSEHRNMKTVTQAAEKNPSIVTTDDVARYIQDKDLDYAQINNIMDGTFFGEEIIYNHKPNNYLKSLWYNNGMFDMTNPNIYKAIVPAAIGVGALQQKKHGGTTYKVKINKPK